MRQRHVGPQLHQLRVDERRDLERRSGAGHRISRMWTPRPRTEPGRDALTEKDGQPQAWTVISATLPQRDPPERFVTGHECGGRGFLTVRLIAQRRFFSARRRARSRLRGCTSSPNRS